MLSLAPLDGVTLRPYQTAAIARVLAEVDAGNRRVLLVAATGAGKTVMFAALAAAFHAAGRRVLAVAHRRELIAQAVAKLHASGIADVGVYRGKARSTNPAATVQVVAIHALKPGLFDADLVIVDEAHHAPAESYLRLLEMYPDAVHVGATATPWWGTGKGLGDYFQAAVTATTVRELTDAGHLARVRMFTHPRTLRGLDLRGVETSGGDYTITSVSERVDRPALLGDIVEHWQTLAGGARTLAFAASVEHSKHITARFVAAGVAAEHVDGTTADNERAAILARLRAGTTRVVSNYNVLTEGFDEPSVGCVILARPTKRAGVYLQAVGRGMRADEGKTSLVVLDHAGACLMHGLTDEERAVNLDGIAPSRGGGVPVRRCPACGLCVPLATMECPECSATLRGAVPTEEPSGVLVEVARGHAPMTLRLGDEELAVDEWAARTGIPWQTIRWRIARGLSAAEILAPSRSRVRMLTYGGETLALSRWSARHGVPPETIRVRMDVLKWPVGEAVGAVDPKTRGKRRFLFRGKLRTVAQISKLSGVPVNTIGTRLKRGYNIKEAAAAGKYKPNQRTKVLVTGETTAHDDPSMDPDVARLVALNRKRRLARSPDAIKGGACVTSDDTTEAAGG